jgi:hypothetical protein
MPADITAKGGDPYAEVQAREIIINGKRHEVNVDPEPWATEQVRESFCRSRPSRRLRREHRASVHEVRPGMVAEPAAKWRKATEGLLAVPEELQRRAAQAEVVRSGAMWPWT